MPKHKKATWEDHTKLLEYLADHSVKEAAKEFKKTENAIYGQLSKIRKTLQTEQAAINRIRTLQRISARVRKFTVSGAVPEEEAEPDNWKT